MGSGVSSIGAPTQQLRCPGNYDEDDFAKILRLYDRLDSDGNMIVEEDELGQIATHHVNNKKKILMPIALKQHIAVYTIHKSYFSYSHMNICWTN